VGQSSGKLDKAGHPKNLSILRIAGN
jgi:hypothetical protein